MKIANGVEMLEISSSIMGNSSVINPTLIWDKDIVILVDAGFPGQLPQIREAIEKAGVVFDKLNMVILTHHDIDHIGSLSAILKEISDNVIVLAHEEEKPYITGEKVPLKVAKLEANLVSLPEKMKVMYEKIKVAFQNCKVNVDKTLIDDELPYCGGIKVIFTPGHTLGHICLYHRQSKTLIAGDILHVEGGKLIKADPSTNFDTDISIKSLKKLTEYDIETVICYHGGLYNENANQRIVELSKER
ncbi:MAG TPA: MBL fold metallo-hydrolase [Clostridium sp.]|uniref:MBL fold metallo-hydrolase n=1 Tax=Clostridium sp. TaxID=1506 RepID=UPI002F942846